MCEEDFAFVLHAEYEEPKHFVYKKFPNIHSIIVPTSYRLIKAIFQNLA